MLENQRPPCKASSGNSTKSARGFSSRIKLKVGLDVDPAVAPGALGVEVVVCTTVGTMFRKVLNPTSQKMLSCEFVVLVLSMLTFDTTSPTSLKSLHRPSADRAKKSSISLVPML